MSKTIFFYVLIRHWKSFEYFDRCIDSVYSQNYRNFKILFIDDASGYSLKRREYIRNKLRGHIIVFNKIRRYSLFNAYYLVNKYAYDHNSIIFNLDGDDWLPHSKCLSEIASIYSKNPKLQMTYGDCFIWNGKLKKRSLVNQLATLNKPYPKHVVKNRTYRSELFLPLHPRTWKVSLFKSIPKKEFMDPRGKWLRFAEDMAVFFPMLEKIKPRGCETLRTPFYVYNQVNPHADINENTIPLLKNELIIRRKHMIDKKFDSTRRLINIKYSKVLSIPIVGDFLYKLQLVLIKHKLTNTIYLSGKNSKLRKSLINKTKIHTVVLNTFSLANVIRNITGYKILNKSDINLNSMKIDDLYSLMWNLVFCDAVTTKTRKAIAQILPTNYPIARI